MATYAGTENVAAFMQWRAPAFRHNRTGDFDAVKVWQVDDDGGPSFVDETEDFNDVGAGDCQPFPSSEATDDYFAIGHHLPFRRLTIDTGTARSGGALAWEYYGEAGWTTLTTTSDGTNTLSTTGAQEVAFEIPEDWTGLSLNGSGELFYIRLRVTSTMTVNPIIDEGYVTDLYQLGLGLVFPNTWNQTDFPGALTQPPVFPSSGVATAGTKSSTPSAKVSKTGSTFHEEFGYNDWWFERVHILPKPTVNKIEFGSIITEQTDNYEIFSAVRGDSVTEVSITNNALPGVTLPDNTPPETLEPLQSLLDPTSTGNSGGSSLGTLVQLSLVAGSEGLASFDTTILFSFPAANDVYLLLSGDRLILFPVEYEGGEDNGPVERLEFLTEIHEAISGKEKRPSPRKNPRQFFETTYILDSTDRQRLQALAFDWLDNQFAFPLWHEFLELTAQTSAGGTQYQVSGADDLDFRVGGLAVALIDADTFDVITISAKTDTLITATDPAVNTYPAGTKIMPCRLAYVRGRIPTVREIVNLQTFKLTWEVVDNDTGVPTASSTPGFWSTYNSRVLFDDCNIVTGQTQGSISRKIVRADNRIGKVLYGSSWDRSKVTGVKGFSLKSRAQIMLMRRLWYALRGQQKAFYLPNFIDDLEVVATLTMGNSTMDILNIGFNKYAKDRLPWTIFRITYTDGTSDVKVVSSSAVVSATVERLTLSTTWGATKTVDEVERVEFYELVRFETDTLRLKYPRIGRAEARAPVVRVFDDNA